MATYIALFDFTEQGVRDFKQSPQRAAAFKDAAQKIGVTVKEVFWTLGAHDGGLGGVPRWGELDRDGLRR